MEVVSPMNSNNGYKASKDDLNPNGCKCNSKRHLQQVKPTSATLFKKHINLSATQLVWAEKALLFTTCSVSGWALQKHGPLVFHQLHNSRLYTFRRRDKVCTTSCGLWHAPQLQS
eukprot:3253049-Amphidinium_carterae.1